MKLAKVVAVIVMPVLFAAWVILFVFSTRTEQLWAWTMTPRMTPITMGAGYFGGVWYFYRVLRSREAHRVAGGMQAAAVFTTLAGIATIVHWDKFNHDHVSFWAWALLYFGSPVLLPILFVLLRRESVQTDEPPVPRWLRNVFVGIGVTQLAAATSWILVPDLARRHWPWELTELSARTLSCYVIFSAFFMLYVLVDPRFSAMQFGIEGLVVGLTMQSIGAIDARDDFTGPAYSRVIYVVGLVALVAFMGWVLRTEGRRTESRAVAVAA